MKSPWKNPMALYYVGNWCYRHHVPLMPQACQMLLYLVTTAVVPFRARIGKGCLLAHGGSGVVIHPDAVIGRNVVIHQQVTVGGTGKGAPRLPVIGDDVYLGAGAKIIGPVDVGSNTVIGANAVVTRSISAGCVAVGVPAHVVREGINAHDIEDW
ncbi:MAG: serine O-acetyltransferase [Gemmatimonadaceae bacterium]